MEASVDTFKVDFTHFLFGVWALGVKIVEGDFQFGEHIIEWCYRLQKYPKTLTVSARKHIKTTVALGFLAWQLYKLSRRYDEWEFMSYTQELGEHQLKRGKRIIGAIPYYFSNLEDITQAESIWHYKKKDYEFFCEPAGILTFKRGKHPRGMICDDVLKDPKASMISFGVLEEIKRAFNDEVQSMPTEQLHVLGTPQDNDDLFADIKKKPGFNCKVYPAWINRNEGKVLWKEKFPPEELIKIEADIGLKAFNKEFMCRPVRSEEGFFCDEELDRITHSRLHNHNWREQLKLNEYAYGGLDIGKKRHPSHLTVYGKDRKKRLVQLLSYWMDSTDYIKQLEICKDVIKNFKLDRLFYDDTRAEFEGFKEAGDLPPEMKGLPFTEKLKYQIAVEFEKRVVNKTILMLADDRQKRQILNVDNDLKSAEMAEGHGDSFWSNALAIHAAQEPEVSILWL